MRVVVWDTVSLLEPLFASREPPKRLLEAAQPFYAPDGLWTVHGRHVQDAYPAWEAAQLDGYEACLAQQMWGLMNPSRSKDASAWAFETFRREELLAKAEGWVQWWALQFEAEALPERLDVFLVPADPANRNLMQRCGGLSAAGLPGCLTATVWPSLGNLGRLEAALARSFVYALRPARTLADHLVREGLASVFAAQIQPGREPWLIPFKPPEGWADELERVAELHEAESYDDLKTNVYGNVLTGPLEPLEAAALPAEEVELAVSLLPQALEETDTNRVAAYLYGDAAVSPQGHPGVGMPSLGGLETAHWMLQNYFARNPHELRWAVRRPSAEVVWESGYLT